MNSMSNIANLQIKKIREEQAFRDRYDRNQKDLQFSSILNANVQSEMRADEKRNLRLLTVESQERAMNDMINKRDHDNTIRREEEAQEIRIAEEMQRLKLDKLKEDKMRQHIRETSVELRELEGKLRAGYTQKERMAQLAEKEALKYDETARDAEIYHRMKDESKQSDVLQTMMHKQKYEENVRYQQELERQLEDKELRRQEEYQETLNDKLMIDEIVRKIYEEDQREREREVLKKGLVKKYIAEFMEQREGWKNLEKDRLDAENEKIAEFAALQAEREGKRQLERLEAEELRTELIKKLSAKIEGDQKEREEMEQIRQDLYEEEQEEKERIKEQQRKDKRMHEMYELQRMESEQKEFKAMRKRAQYDEEQLFKQQMLSKFAEDDRIEQMNAQKRRMKQLEHRRAVESLLSERRETFARDRERDLEERRREDEINAFRKQVIEQERQRMLREHAPNLLGYLPKGVIQDKNDLVNLGNDFQEYYKPQPLNPFDCDA